MSDADGGKGEQQHSCEIRTIYPVMLLPTEKRKLGHLFFWQYLKVLLTDFNNLSPLEPEMEKGSEATQKL